LFLEEIKSANHCLRWSGRYAEYAYLGLLGHWHMFLIAPQDASHVLNAHTT